MHRVEVALVDADSGAEVARCDLPTRTGDVWHGLVSPRRAGPGTCYAFYVHGPNEPEKGHRFDATAALIDPYARSLSLEQPLRSRVIDSGFDWAAIGRPRFTWRDTLIYELHVKGFTRLHPRCRRTGAVKISGDDGGSGDRTLEVRRASRRSSCCRFSPSSASSFWSTAHSAITGATTRSRGFRRRNEYAVQDAVAEFKTMVKALHAAGIEVILDVVFNHTAEGNESGPLLSWRGIDNSVYYRLMPQDKRFYEKRHRLRQHRQLRAPASS